MMLISSLTWGKSSSTGDIVHIRSVDNGLACDCICPTCEDRLVAHQGKKTAWHFKHHNGDECKYALETALHLKAKEILSNSKYIHLPALDAVAEESPNRKVINSVVGNSQRIALDEIKVVESKIGRIIPDIIVYSKQTPLLVEIAVTHFIDPVKRSKIRDLGISCIEIDLSDYRDKDIDEHTLEEIVVNKVQHKNWIFNKHLKQAQVKARNDLKALIEESVEHEKQRCSQLVENITKYYRSVTISSVRRIESKDTDEYEFYVVVKTISVDGGEYHIKFQCYDDGYVTQIDGHNPMIISKQVELSGGWQSDEYTDHLLVNAFEKCSKFMSLVRHNWLNHNH